VGEESKARSIAWNSLLCLWRSRHFTRAFNYSQIPDVFARVTPAQKLEIARFSSKRG
jgi:hypothetical protein